MIINESEICSCGTRKHGMEILSVIIKMLFTTKYSFHFANGKG